MSHSLSTFIKNDKIYVEKLTCEANLRTHLEALGLFEGASAVIFYRDKRNLILQIGRTKLAISEAVGKSIFASAK